MYMYYSTLHPRHLFSLRVRGPDSSSILRSTPLLYTCTYLSFRRGLFADDSGFLHKRHRMTQINTFRVSRIFQVGGVPTETSTTLHYKRGKHRNGEHSLIL